MKAIIRRLRRLEEKRFGTAADIEFARQLRERIEQGRGRVAEAMGLSEWPGSVGDDERENLAGLSRTEILHRGRARVARANAERAALQRAIASEGHVSRPGQQRRCLFPQAKRL
jgi:hypothetical protein